MKKNNFKVFIISSFCIFIAIIIVYKFTGYTDRFSTAFFESISWNEIYLEIPRLIVASLIFGFFFTLLYKDIKKKDEKDIENARKRIEERERNDKMRKDQNK